jgi:putative cardiolipin synthase
MEGHTTAANAPGKLRRGRIPDFTISSRSFFRFLILALCSLSPAAYSAQSGTAADNSGNPSSSDHDTRLARSIAAHKSADPDTSGFGILRRGREAFTSRIALTELAEKTLDLQYYIWEADATGRIFADRLVSAADRGVHVRVLLDDINLKGRDDIIASLDVHPNIEIRLFNPFTHRSTRFLDFLGDFGRINHRMHNKVMIADNAISIVGGRNIGDHYFQVDADANFRDLDIAVGGPLVHEISGVFDYFFDGEWSVPISSLVEDPFTEEDLRENRATLKQRISEDDYPHPLDEDVAQLHEHIDTSIDSFVWAPGQIIWDDPKSIQTEGKTSRMQEALFRKAETLESELLIESAYFVVRDRGIETLKMLNEKGIRIRALTNSLASNDVLAAHAGYSASRKDLVRNGVELYELRPDAGSISQRVFSGRSKAALHTKAVVFDRKDVFIGSFNLDPRSGDINTEAGIYVESPELAKLVIEYMDEGVTPQNSYRVILNEQDDLVWIYARDGQEVRSDVDPESKLWQRLVAAFLRILPIAGQL